MAARDVDGVAPPAAAELDALTLRRAQRGDDDACRALVERYQRPVFALLGRMLAEPAQVEDVAQETFLHVFRQLAGFAPLGPARLSTWILTIASRRAIDALRARPPEGLPLETVAERLPAPGRADRDARRHQLAAAVEAAVRGLSADHRAVFLLREYHGFDYVAIARALDIDVGTVRSRLSRARAALRQALGDHASEVSDE